MPIAFTLREMQPADSPALATLIAQSPDSGQVQFSPRFHIPAVEVFQARHENMQGVVAEVEGVPGIVGAAHISGGTCQIENSVQPYALLSGLVVHPEYRRQGIAAALAQWRVDYARARAKEEVLLVAAIQKGNDASRTNARKWATHFSGEVITSPVPMRRKAPAPVDSITVRPAQEEDLEVIAHQLNAFYQPYNLYRPQSATALYEWLRATPLDMPIHHYIVATDAANRILAGVGILEESRLLSLHIEKVPPFIQVANLLLNVIPRDREMRNLHAEKLWFAPGHLEVARHLWQTLRWEWRERGSSLVCHFDPRSPIRAVLQNPFWSPTTSVSFALRTHVPISTERLIDPLL